MNGAFAIFSGSANPALAGAVARRLDTPLGDCSIERFPDGEVSIRLGEPVRHRQVFIIQPTCPPVDNHLVELLAFVDACRRGAAAEIVAVIPYFGYARSDKRRGRPEPINARMVADMLEAVGVSHVVTMDLHAAQIEGFFHVPVDTLTAVPSLAAEVSQVLRPNTVIISPDVGRMHTAIEYSSSLDAPVVVLHKQRESGTTIEVTNVAGDVRGRPCLIVDDMISTAGTIAGSIDALLAAGALPDVLVAATHGLFTDGARERLSHSALRAIYVTDTLPPPATCLSEAWPDLHVVSIAPILAAAIGRISAGGDYGSPGSLRQNGLAIYYSE